MTSPDIAAIKRRMCKRSRKRRFMDWLLRRPPQMVIVINQPSPWQLSQEAMEMSSKLIRSKMMAND